MPPGTAEVLGPLIELATAEARLLGHSFLGVEHLLLGLLRDENGVAARALASLEVSIDVMRKRVREIDATASAGGPEAEALPLTARAEKVIEFSREEALYMGASEVAAEHVLLAIVDEGQSVAAAVLREQLGPDLIVVRRRVMHLLEPSEVVAEPPGQHSKASAVSVKVEQSRRRHARGGPAEFKCSFCGKSQKQVEKIIAGPGVFICDECVDLCVEIIDEERRDRT